MYCITIPGQHKKKQQQNRLSEPWLLADVIMIKPHVIAHLYSGKYGPRRDKTCLRGVRQSEFQNSLHSYRD